MASAPPASIRRELPLVLAVSAVVTPDVVVVASTATTLPALNSAGPTEVIVIVLLAVFEPSSAPNVIVPLDKKPKACGEAVSVETSVVAGPKVEPSLNFKVLVVPICNSPGTFIEAFFPMTTPFGLRR